MPEAVVIKKSPLVVIKNLIILEFLVTGGYLIAGVLANYGELYKGFTFSQAISYEIVKFLFISLGELALVTYIFLRWIFSAYTVYPNRVVREYGLFLKQRRTTELTPPLSVSCRYDFLSRFFKHGTLLISDKRHTTPIALKYVPSPKFYLKLITEQQATAADSAVYSRPADIKEVLKSREGERVEFKASLRWDTQEAKFNRGLEKAVMKSVAAFLNSKGGHVVIGVDDKGAVLGVQNDYQTLKKQDADGFEIHFTNIFKDAIGPEFRRFVQVSFHDIEGKEVCLLSVAPSAAPAYMRFGNEEVFYIRTGNSTTALQVSEVPRYIKSRWRKYE